ncbi:hypothetical protein [Streptomyces sp. NPDC001530]|uniref:hypothetical protein n=1 Tax=Streptomyces sp. NPDC001530 TaxID=3364582 RepID=UPI0036CE35E8
MIARPPSPIPVPHAAPDIPLAEPPARDWEDDPHIAARYDDRYWDDMYDRDEE